MDHYTLDNGNEDIEWEKLNISEPTQNYNWIDSNTREFIGNEVHLCVFSLTFILAESLIL